MAYARVVIVGGGFGGLNASKVLGNKKIEVWVVDKTNHHLFQPLLYQVASAALSPADIALPIREILNDYENITVIMGNVTAINKTEKYITLANGEMGRFDYLILAPGARHSYFGKDSWEPFAPGLKTLPDALNLREKILISFEKAERCDSFMEARKYLNFVIIGGGPTGVELAGSIAEIAYETMLKDFRRIDTKHTKIYLVEGSPHILPSYPEKLSFRAQKYLEKFGVIVLTGKKVTNVTQEGVHIENTFIDTKNIIWAAGNQAAPLLKTLEVPLDRQGRVIVEGDLSITGYPDIFVIGDAAAAADKTGKMLPGLAPVAIQQGRYVARLILKNLPKEKRLPFKYVDKGMMATIGKSKAIGMFGKVQFYGFFAWLAWSFVHILYLIGFRNKLFVLSHWLFSYYSSQRGSRLIYRSLSIDEDLPNPYKH